MLARELLDALDLLSAEWTPLDTIPEEPEWFRREVLPILVHAGDAEWLVPVTASNLASGESAVVEVAVGGKWEIPFEFRAGPEVAARIPWRGPPVQLVGGGTSAVRLTGNGIQLVGELQRTINEPAGEMSVLCRWGEVLGHAMGTSDYSIVAGRVTMKLQDGPTPDGFRAMGKEFAISEPTARRLVVAVWNAPSRTLSYEDAARQVWLDRDEEITTGKAKRQQRNINDAIAESGWSLGISNGTFSLNRETSANHRA